MIRYTLVCPQDHQFESWFRDSDAYDSLAAADAVACPTCGGTKVRKALMAPSVVTVRARATVEVKPVSAASAPDDGPSRAVALMDDQAKQLRAMVRELHQRITENADDVGRSFASEARAIHEGSAPSRSIYGEATREEVSALIEDDIPLMPMPRLPDERH